MIDIQIKISDSRIGTQFSAPSYATDGSAGIDLCACCDQKIILTPSECQLISTGISIYIADKNYVALIFPRSGLGVKKGIVLGNLTGVIDSDYQGPLMVPLWNRSETYFEIEPGLRMAQLVIVPTMQANFKVVDEFSHVSERGKGGFGHTGLK